MMHFLGIRLLHVAGPFGMGVLPINGRRGRRDEFNPFAKDASQQHRRRRDERERQATRRAPATPEEKPAPPEDIQADLERKQREAIEKLEQKGDVVAPTVAPAPVPQPLPKPVKEQETTRPSSREDRLAELRRKSEALKKAAPSIQAETTVEPALPTVETEAEQVAVHEEHDDEEDEGDDVVVKANSKRVKNVFREIETKIEPKQDRRRGRRRMDKKGGGRQKQQKKLNRQKYLEYKYAAKAVLDHPSVPEEHRSNVLGQIWAKGERLGIDDSIEFIEQKEAELILPTDVADELRSLVKQMTTRR
jgi:hypothetical protein